MQIIAIGVPDDIPRVAIPILIGSGHPQQDLVIHDRDVDRAFKFLVVVITELALNIAFKVVRRLFGNEQHRAASRVASEQRSLWAV